MSSRYYSFLLVALLTLTITSIPLFGQTIINIPPDIAPRTIGADAIVNLFPGGTLDVRGAAIASDGAVVNVLGGRVGELVVETTATVNVDNGGVHERFWAEDNGQIFHRGGRTEAIFLSSAGLAELSGGAIETIGAIQSSTLTIKGVNIAINGVPVSGLDQVDDTVSINLPAGSILTAILADGTPFGRVQQNGAQATMISDGVLTLQRAVDPLPLTPGTVVIDTTSDLTAIGAEQIVQVVESGRLREQFRAGPDSRVEVNGGRIDAAFHAIGAEVVVNEGRVDRRLNAFDSAVVTLRGGFLNGDARFHRGSTLNIEGGEAGAGIWLREGATLNLRDGTIFEAVGFEGSELNVTGGDINRISTSGGRINLMGGSIVGSLDAINDGTAIFSGGRHTDNISFRGAQMEIQGGNIRVNGIPLAGLNQPGDSTMVSLDGATTLSGVYADGTPFVLSGEQEDIRSAITVVESTVAAPMPPIVRVPNDPVPNGVGNGQTLILSEGGVLPSNFTAGHGSTVLLQGGEVGNNFEMAGALVNFSGGQTGLGMDAFVGTVLNISGTANWSGLDAHAGSVTSISGGMSNGEGIDAFPSATVNVSGGEVRGLVQAEGANINISGGLFTGLRQRAHQATSGSTVNLSGGMLVGSGLQVLSGSRLFASGGEVEGLLISNSSALINGGKTTGITVADSSTVEVTDGDIGDSDILQGGRMRLFGGTMADSHEWLSGVGELHGYNFQVNGVPLAGLETVGNTVPLSLPEGGFFSGVLSDGTPFAISSNDEFQNVVIRDGVVTLTQTEVPALPDSITVSNGTAPRGISGNRTLIVENDGKLHGNFVAGPGSTLEIRGGEVGGNFEADRSNILIEGGVVGDHADAFQGALFTIIGGVIGDKFEAHSGSRITISGGEVRSGFDALPNSTVILKEGFIGTGFEAIGANVTISGGEIDNGFKAIEGAHVTLLEGVIGAQFEANSGAQLDIRGGRIRSSFDARGNAVLNISGGVFDTGFAARGVEVVVNVSGGDFGGGLLAGEGAVINVRGGQLGDQFDVFDAKVNISDGEIGDRFQLRQGAMVHMSGGTVADHFEIRDQAEIVISGGEFGDLFRAFDGSMVTIEGFGFELDGVPVAGLDERLNALILEDRGGALLTGFFADGTSFQFQLNDVLHNPPQDPPPGPGPRNLLDLNSALSDFTIRDTTFDFFAQGATLQIVSTVPEPATYALFVGIFLVGVLQRVERQKAA